MKVKAKEIFEKITSVRALLFYILLSIWSLIDIVSGTLDVDIDTGYGASIPVEVTNSSYDPVNVEVTNHELDVEVTNSWLNAVPVDPQ